MHVMGPTDTPFLEGTRICLFNCNSAQIYGVPSEAMYVCRKEGTKSSLLSDVQRPTPFPSYDGRLDLFKFSILHQHSSIQSKSIQWTQIQSKSTIVLTSSPITT
jgi:hypothetical protein